MLTTRNVGADAPFDGAFTRDGAEAHLTLHGWVPVVVVYGACGARNGNTLIYVYEKRLDDIYKDGHESPDGKTLETGRTFISGDMTRHDLGMWFWSDRLFWKLFKAVAEYTYDRSD